MQQIKTLDVIRLQAGLLQLDKNQASRRQHLIEPAKGRDLVFVIMQPVTFKAGEVFGFEGEIPKPFIGSKIELLDAGDDEQEQEPELLGVDDVADDQMPQRMAQIIDACGKVADIDMTQNSGPKLAALKAAAGLDDISEAERNEAWQLFRSHQSEGNDD